jgi:DNA (cytosine-5)-methyltransferase 1
MEKLAEEGRAPELIVLENVCGALTSHDGADFAAICGALADCGYRFGALAIDAVHFLPQSRPRLFVIAVRVGLDAAKPFESLVEKFGDRSEEVERGGGRLWRSATLLAAHAKLPKRLQEAWIWWRLPIPPQRTASLEGILEADPEGVAWNTPEQTLRLQSMMSPLHRRKVELAARAQRRVAGAVYRRTRRDKKGRPLQRAEVRFDGVAGCLRTPAGGSSRQTILIVEGGSVRSRLLSPREAARLMGLPESYRLPENYNQAYHLAGDGVAVPVVRFLAAHLLEPLLAASGRNKDAA